MHIINMLSSGWLDRPQRSRAARVNIGGDRVWGEDVPPEVSEPAVSPDLLQPLKVLSQLVVQTVGKNLQTQNQPSDPRSHQPDPPLPSTSTPQSSSSSTQAIHILNQRHTIINIGAA